MRIMVFFIIYDDLQLIATTNINGVQVGKKTPKLYKYDVIWRYLYIYIFRCNTEIVYNKRYNCYEKTILKKDTV